MNQFNKNLMIVITVILLIFIIQNGINNYENKLYNNFRNNTIEKFEGMDLTQISRFEPRQGDSSTIITIEGNGLDFIGEVLFDGRECLIFDDRTDTKVKILPPSLNELGKTIQEVRQIINEGKDIGLPIKDIQIIRRTADKTNVLTDDKLKLEGIRFHYIDKINYVDNCPKLEEPPKEELDILEPEEIDISNEKPGSDMEFIKEIIPNKLAHLEKLIEKQNNIIQYYETLNIDNNNIEYLSQIQALETLATLKKEFNIQRYNIHKTMASRYGYSF